MTGKLAGLCCLIALVCPDAGAAGKFNRVLSVGDSAPQWAALPAVDGTRKALKDYAHARLVLVVFTCNHCPVAQAYEQRMIALARRFNNRELQLVAISCSLLKSDNLQNMKRRARERKYPFDYLYDASQGAGHAYGATVTPHVFLLDRKRRVVYMGAFDDNLVPGQVEEHYVIDAVEAARKGMRPDVVESRQKGCPIEYR
ncbi:MAG: thioredoxin family protein, partial [Planctomycetaceae bacterium]